MTKLDRMLVVDDDRTNIEVLKEIFCNRFNLLVARSGEDAVTIAKEWIPDIILLDIMMPGIDGYETCRRMRAIEGLKYSKIILVSAKGMLEDRLKGYKVGADDYIMKPFDDEEIKAKIEVYSHLKHIEEVNRLKNDLLMLFSHETCTPLNTILGFSELLKKRKEDPQASERCMKCVEWAHMIEESGKDLLTFVKKTLFLCDLQKGYELSIEPCSMSDIITDAVADARSNSFNTEVSIIFVNKISRKIYLDSNLFCRAISYVIANAIKFSPEGATVSIFSEVKNDRCIVSISDQGEGINDEDKDRIFESFSVQDVCRHSKGQGLSLAIARRIARLHGGELSVHNNEEKGACFIFDIPLKISSGIN